MEEKQEKKPEFKGKMGIIWLVGILVIVLGCVTVYTLGLLRKNGVPEQLPPEPQTIVHVEAQKTENTTSEEKAETTKTTTTEKTTYTCSYLKGTYVSEDRLYLFEDGTYNYEENGDAAYGYFGNYIINEDEIVLNQLFGHGSDIGIFPDKKQVKGIINKDKSITLKLEKDVKFNKKTTSTSGNYDTLYEAVKRFIKYLEDRVIENM